MRIKLSDGRNIPIEMHKVRIVQKTTLPPAEQRLRAITEAGYNTFLLRSRDILIDLLTDSGTNAMSDNQLAAMMVSDDAYAGYNSTTQDPLKLTGFGFHVPSDATVTGIEGFSEGNVTSAPGAPRVSSMSLTKDNTAAG